MSFLNVIGRIVVTAIAARIADRAVELIFCRKEKVCTYKPTYSLRTYTKEMFVNGTYVGDKRADEILAKNAPSVEAPVAPVAALKVRHPEAVAGELASALGQFVNRVHRIEQYGAGACFDYKESFCMLGEILHEIKFMAKEHEKGIDSFLSFIEKSIHNEQALREAAQQLVKAVT